VGTDAEQQDARSAAVPNRATTILKMGQAAPLFSLPDSERVRVDLARFDCVVIGVSPDDCLRHAEFGEANGVSIVLLADTECEVCEKYGVLQADTARRWAFLQGNSFERLSARGGT